MFKKIFLKWYNNEYCLASVKNNGYNLQFVKNQTEEICLAAIKRHRWALKYVKNQTEEICLEALNQNVKAGICIDKEKFPLIYEKYQFLTI